LSSEKQTLSPDTEQTTIQTNSNDSPFAALLALTNEKKTKVPRVIATESFTITNHKQDDFEDEDCENDSSIQSLHEDEEEDNKSDEDPKFLSTLNLSRFNEGKTTHKHTSNNQSSISDFLHNDMDNESCAHSRKRKKCTKFLSDFWASDEDDNLDDDNEWTKNCNELTTQKKTKYSKEEPNSLHSLPSTIELHQEPPTKQQQQQQPSSSQHNTTQIWSSQ
jgi:hypothetical protein